MGELADEDGEMVAVRTPRVKRPKASVPLDCRGDKGLAIS